MGDDATWGTQGVPPSSRKYEYGQLATWAGSALADELAHKYDRVSQAFWHSTLKTVMTPWHCFCSDVMVPMTEDDQRVQADWLRDHEVKTQAKSHSWSKAAWAQRSGRKRHSNADGLTPLTCLLKHILDVCMQLLWTTLLLSESCIERTRFVRMCWAWSVTWAQSWYFVELSVVQHPH